MGLILVELDNQLKQSDIIVPLTAGSKDLVGEDNYNGNTSGKQQSSIYGIIAPLIEINNIVIDFSDVIEFSLISKSRLPLIHVVAHDKYDFSSSIDIPKNDNQMRVQILPPFDEAYKKINLTFYITKIDVYDGIIEATGVLKVPDLTSTQFKCLGELNTYDLFKLIATETKLGFATNVQSNDLDKRYVYCDYISYLDTMENEIQNSGAPTQIMDFWIDFWNNINLVDIYDRYTTVDEEKDMLIWVSGQQGQTDEGLDQIPMQTGALLNNHPANKNTELYVVSYDIVNNGNQLVFEGTDKVYSTYEMEKKEYLDYLVLDGDVKKDVFIKHEYLGEVYGKFNYLQQHMLREAFLQKVNSESMQITLKSPLLGIMRGSKIDFNWYIIDDLRRMKIAGLAEDGYIDKNPQSNIAITDDSEPVENQFEMDKNLSGQYLVTSVEIYFEEGEWSYVLTLNRPADTTPQVLLVPEEEK